MGGEMTKKAQRRAIIANNKKSVCQYCSKPLQTEVIAACGPVEICDDCKDKIIRRTGFNPFV